MFFFFQAEDGIRDLVRSRGLGDVYKRQVEHVLLAMFKFDFKASQYLKKHGGNYEKIRNLIIDELGYGDSDETNQRISPKLEEIITQAVQLSNTYGERAITPEHIMAALCLDSSNYANHLMKRTGVDIMKLTAELRKYFFMKMKREPVSYTHLTLPTILLV